MILIIYKNTTNELLFQLSLNFQKTETDYSGVK